MPSSLALMSTNIYRLNLSPGEVNCLEIHYAYPVACQLMGSMHHSLDLSASYTVERRFKRPTKRELGGFVP